MFNGITQDEYDRRWESFIKMKEHANSDKIVISKSKTADTRTTSDYPKVTKEQLLSSTKQHIEDVKDGIFYIIKKLNKAANKHDHTKINKIDDFHKDFITGFKQSTWWDMHKKEERHHLDSHIPDNVDLIDVIEYLVDGVMAGMGRSGKYIKRKLPKDLLDKAFDNTVNKLLDKIEVVDEK